jgi:hypothetical protein
VVMRIERMVFGSDVIGPEHHLIWVRSGVSRR